MKQQILVVHGGTTFNTYNEYLSFLRKSEISLEDFHSHSDWKDNLQNMLGLNYDVFQPTFPCKKNAKYEEWKIWFEKIVPLLDDNPIFIGHSLGGIFLAKYLSENIIPLKIKAVILVAAPFDDIGTDRSLGSFKVNESLNNLVDQVKNIYLIQSKDDPSVSFENVEKYMKTLPDAKTLIFENRGHFRQERFPEIVELIKNI